MKLRFIVSVSLLTILLIISTVNTVQASWNAINSGQGAVTTNFHGINVPIGETVVATAGTTNNQINEVTFHWVDPYGNWVRNETTALSLGIPLQDIPTEVSDWAEDNDGTPVWCAQDSYDPDSVGDWTVKITLHYITGEECEEETKFKATSFFVVDEVPLGTIVTLAIPFGFLGFVAIKKKRTPKTK